MKERTILSFSVQTPYLGKFCLTGCWPKCFCSIFLKEYVNIFIFLQGDIYKWKVISKAITFGWMCGHAHAQPTSCIDSLRVPLVGLGVRPD